MNMQLVRPRLWLLILTITFSTAFATEQDHECQGGHNCNDDVNIDFDGGDSNADSNSYSESSSSSESGSSSGASSDNNVAVTFTRPSSTTVRNVASPDTPNVYPSAPCRIARSAGLSLAGGSLSGGSSIEDPECTLREAARVFQYLGVPEVGLHLMCTQSLVVNGRRDKKGNLEKGYGTPIGTAECLRLVRMFQGSDDASDAETAQAAEIKELRQQQDRIESGLIGRVNELEQQMMEQEQAPPPRPRVTQQTVQQPMLNDEKRAKLTALFGDNEDAGEER